MELLEKWFAVCLWVGKSFRRRNSSYGHERSWMERARQGLEGSRLCSSVLEISFGFWLQGVADLGLADFLCSTRFSNLSSGDGQSKWCILFSKKSWPKQTLERLLCRVRWANLLGRERDRGCGNWEESKKLLSFSLSFLSSPLSPYFIFIFSPIIFQALRDYNKSSSIEFRTILLPLPCFASLNRRLQLLRGSQTFSKQSFRIDL